MMAVNTADAGVVHARSRLRYHQPATEGYSGSGIADTASYIGRARSETNFGGLNYPHNLGYTMFMPPTTGAVTRLLVTL